VQDIKVTTLKDFFVQVNKGKKLKKPFDIFHNTYDMENYGPDTIQYAMENIKVMGSKVNKAGGRRCNAQDWATVHWKTYDEYGQKLEDSRKYKKKRPTVFKIGSFTTAKCWDISLVNLHA